MTKQRLALMYGGKSSEHEVSIRSATEVLAAIDRDRFEPVPIAVTREGRFKTGAPSHGLGKIVIDGEDVLELGSLLRSCSCVFPLLHGPCRPACGGSRGGLPRLGVHAPLGVCSRS